MTPSSSSKSCRPRSICRELSDCTVTVMPGWLCESGVVRSETQGSEVGIAPIRSWPDSPPRKRVELGVEAADVREDPPGPLEHLLALRRQPFVALRASDDREADVALEAADAR